MPLYAETQLSALRRKYPWRTVVPGAALPAVPTSTPPGWKMPGEISNSSDGTWFPLPLRKLPGFEVQSPTLPPLVTEMVLLFGALDHADWPHAGGADAIQTIPMMHASRWYV
jgi:hypothetical protein